MNAERKKPQTLAGIAPEASPRHHARVSEGELRAAKGTIVPPADDSDSGSTVSPAGEVPSQGRRSEFTETGLSWKSLLGIEDPPRHGAASDAWGKRRPFSETRAVSSRHPGLGVGFSAGYYSSRPEPEYLGPESGRETGVKAQRQPKADSDQRLDETRQERVDLEFTEVERTMDRNIERDRSIERDRNIERTSDGNKGSEPRPIFFPTHVREQAAGWLRTGSLSLPNCSSPRHKRAAQRALLLALLASPGYDALPLGLKQRVGWLFSPGWESIPTGSTLSEINDLMTVLGVPWENDAREILMRSVVALLPDPMPLVRPPSSYPPARR